MLAKDIAILSFWIKQLKAISNFFLTLNPFLINRPIDGSIST